jgi:hypothetical protein
MPINCPSHPVPGFDCLSCRFYNRETDSCRLYFPEKRLADILLISERFLRLEEWVRVLETELIECKVNTGNKLIVRPNPKLAEGIKL